jgi:hypothetical protein
MIKTIVLSGAASEYVLGPLEQRLIRSGFEVVALDFLQFKGDAVSTLKAIDGKSTAFITSGHINLSLAVAKYLSPKFSIQFPNYLSPLQIMANLRPAISIFVPHDLLHPFGAENLGELRFIDLFDYVLVPYGTPVPVIDSKSTTAFIQAGYTKALAEFSPLQLFESNDEPKVALFICGLYELLASLSDSQIIDYFSPLIGPNVRIKLPLDANSSRIESLFERKFPGSTVASDVNSLDLIRQSDLVIANSVSSIHVEADLMGKMVVCLADPSRYDLASQRQLLSNLNGLLFHDYSSRAPITHLMDLAQEAKTVTLSKGPIDFDYGLLLDILSRNTRVNPLKKILGRLVERVKRMRILKSGFLGKPPLSGA